MNPDPTQAPRALIRRAKRTHARIHSVKGQAQEKERKQYLLKMLESYKKVLEVNGRIDAGTLPPAARDALVYYGSWALSEANRLTARPES
ncbi:hypothetical protein G5V57_12180 [Nordella sp. HKS 07]|uniref:hypothetical protein n=1 Tax=Nordella sp. HKS 07 TaxID=2712222 RepID=UPI0013E1A749|nr:hypothetical protein [Nordella sp. HKS 07]QIG48414.1 hypothetical protein G5V57_12180 [Nordella sp. HKS 07]